MFVKRLEIISTFQLIKQNNAKDLRANIVAKYFEDLLTVLDLERGCTENFQRFVFDSIGGEF